MKNCILTPTYEGHFKFIEKYLQSYDAYVKNSEEVTLAFVLSTRAEVELFNPIIEPYIKKHSIKVYVFEEIAKNYGVLEPSDEILKKYGGTSYQMLKKFYAMMYIDAERYLVLDSEATWIAETDMSKAFRDFYENPYVLVSKFSSRTRKSQFLEDHFDATNYILGYPMEAMHFEHFMWFYTKPLIQSVIDKYGDPYEMMVRVYNHEMQTKGYSVGLMEAMLCLNYIYENKDALGYRVVWCEDELEKYLGEDGANNYISRFFEESEGGHLGMLEFPCDMVTKENYVKLAELFRTNCIWITRCDFVTFKTRETIEMFLKMADIKLLAVGQSHIFLPGLSEEETKNILKQTVKKQFILKLKKIIKKLIGRK